MAMPGLKNKPLRRPILFEKSLELDAILKKLSAEEIGKIMKISPTLTQKTHALIQGWTTDPKHQSLTIDSFIGDIYSGLRAEEFSEQEREYADKHLYILSGLYGILRPMDAIAPYRLEMGYKLSGPGFKNLYEFWADHIAKTLPEEELIINLASEEFSQVITRFVNEKRLITPQFLTFNPKAKKPSFVAVHAKIARGAFARWLIIHQAKKTEDLSKFNDLNYHFDQSLSTAQQPAFVCQEFGGKGLSIKLKA